MAAATRVSAPPVTPPSPAPAPPRSGAYREVGPVRHQSIHAQRYRLKGTGKILGEVDAEEVVLDGLVSVGASLHASRFTFGGTVDIGGDLTVEEGLEGKGSIVVGGAVRAGSATLGGITRARKDLEITWALSSHGPLEVGGDASAALFSIDGALSIGGTLRAREVLGQFDGESHAETVEATHVALRPKGFVRLPIDLAPLRPKGSLTIGRLEADRVELEGVTVHYLKARAVVLGRHCHVTRLEGKLLKRDRTSHVGYESRSPPPPGLSR